MNLDTLPWSGDGRPLPASEAGFYEDFPAAEFRATVAAPPGGGPLVLDVACLGYYRLTVNGQPVDGDALAPLWSPFEKTVYADRLVAPASLLRPGRNEIRLLLGNGWRNIAPLHFWGHQRFRDELSSGRPAFKVAVQGGAGPLVWEWRETPILRNDVYLGTTFDASRPADAAWRPAVEVPGARGRVTPRLAPAVRFFDEGARGSARWLEEGRRQVVDFGANATGRARFDLRGLPRGRRLEFLYGERLNEDGSVNVLTQTAGQIKRPGAGGPGAPDVACPRDVYIAGDEGPADFAFPFAWRVFRYVEVRGCARLLDGAAFDRLSPDLATAEPARSFRAPDDYLARLHEVCRRTFLSNLVGVQSDCPGRERLGYGGDIVATCDAFMLNWDMREFYLKTLQDFADEADDDGWITETAPYVGIASGGFGGRSGPISWALAVPVLIDALLRHYPDVRNRALAYYPVCARYVRLLAAKFPDGAIPFCIGDHEAIERAPDDVTATAHWHRFAALTASFARLLGREGDAAEFDAVAGRAKQAFQARHVRDGLVANGTQSAQAIALFCGLVPEADEAKALGRLVDAVIAKGYAPTTGIFSTRYMLLVLSERGRLGVAERIVRHAGFPGWRHMLDRGATTLWETWEESDNVYSNCHPMFGSVDEWILSYSRRCGGGTARG